VPAAELVRGDRVKLSLGSVVAADVHHRRWVRAARSIDAHRRIAAHRSRRRRVYLCGSTGAAR
jgi:hypothetical protein